MNNTIKMHHKLIFGDSEKKNISISIFLFLIFISSFLLGIKTTIAEGKVIYTPLKNIVGEKIRASVFDRSENKNDLYRIAIIVKEGVYYELNDNYYIAKKLPDIGQRFFELSSCDVEGGENKHLYYYIENGNGLKGWVDEEYISHVDIYGEVNVDLLNLRYAPDINSEVIKKSKKCDILSIQKRSSNKDNINNITGYWVFISSEEDKICGWVFEPYITILKPYIYIQILENSNHPPPSVVIGIVDEILSAPDRKFWGYIMGPPPDYEEKEEFIQYDDVFFQSQALYYGCNELLKCLKDYERPELINKVFEWIEILEEDYKDFNIIDDLGYINKLIPKCAFLKMEAYKWLNDWKKYNEILINAYKSYGAIEYEGGYFDFKNSRPSGISYFGLELIDHIFEDRKELGTEKTIDILDIFLSSAPSRLNAAFALLRKGEVLAEKPERRDEAIIIFKEVINKYPDAEYTVEREIGSDATFNCAQGAIFDVIKLLKTEKEKKDFLKQYTGENVPLPIRYLAVYLLTHGR